MGYDLHITRKADWCDKGNDISLEEWYAVVAADPEMRLEGYVDWRQPDGSVLRVKLATWVSWPHHVEGIKMVGLCWCDGNVDAKNPDEEIRRKMWRLAQILNARVQGDDGECYDEQGNSDSDQFFP